MKHLLQRAPVQLRHPALERRCQLVERGLLPRGRAGPDRAHRPQAGRYVRVRLRGTDFLGLAEVQVFAP